MQPYPGPIDSAAAYWSMLAHYIPQIPNSGVTFMADNELFNGLFFVMIFEPLKSFEGHTVQECVLKLHEWVMEEYGQRKEEIQDGSNR